MDRYEVCFPITLQQESGAPQSWGRPIVRTKWSYLNDPYDSQGATMCGVTHREYDAFRVGNGLPQCDVRVISDHEIITIFRRQYWDAVPCAGLPHGVDVVVYDAAIHTGVGQSIKFLQRALGVPADAHLGVVTIQALQSADPSHVVERFMEERRKHGRSLKNFWRFKKNWERRWSEIEAQAQDEAKSATRPAHAPPPLKSAASAERTDVAPVPKAREASAQTMAQSSTGNAAATAGAMGSAQMGVDIAKAMAKTKADAAGGGFDAAALVLELAQSASFWIGLGIVVPVAYIWLERRRKMLLGAA